ncbi:MAG: O-antigen ligase family protein [Pseudomonadales bacterium]|nr:O-antigen ligase family protein [Candidatus Woesebacteria bacterium]MCB9801941.1 O-antigen ligase family protein [Pseudomonadales bacterium]
MRKRIVTLFQIYLFTLPFVFTWINTELFEFNKMVFTYGFAVIVVALWLIEMVHKKTGGLRKTVFDIPLALFLLSQMISTALSMHPYTSLFGYYSRFHGGLLSTLAYLAIYYAAVNTLQKKDIPKLMHSLVISTALVSVYGILEHFGHSPSCALITGSFNVSCWVQTVQIRVFASFGQPNWMATYLVGMIPLTVLLGAYYKERWVRLIYGVSSIFMTMALIFTGSRSGFLAFLASGVITLVFLWMGRKNITHLEEKKNMLAGTLGAILAVVLVFGSPYSPGLVERISPIKVVEPPPLNRLEQGGTDSGEIRKIVWRGAIDVWRRHPLFGSGVETFAYSYYQDRPVEHNLVSEWSFLYNKAHNEYLNTAATTGTVGLIALLLLQGALIWQSYLLLKKKQTPFVTTITVGVIAGSVAVWIANFFGFSTVTSAVLGTVFYIVIAIFGKKDIDKSSKKYNFYQKNHSFFRHVRGEKKTIGILCVACLAFLYQLFVYWNTDRIFAKGQQYIEAGEYAKGLDALEQAVQIRPNEALYSDYLADVYAQIAAQLHENSLAEATEFEQNAIALSDTALALNPVHLNFYHSRIRIDLLLSTIDAQYLDEALEYTKEARERSPTDPTLPLTMAEIYKRQEQTELTHQVLEEAIALKPNYEAAWQSLMELQLAEGYEDEAKKSAQYILENINTANERALEVVEKNNVTQE